MKSNVPRHTAMTVRHWFIVLAGILIAFGPCALVYNVWSIFVVPVSNELGVASSQFTFFITLVYLIGGIAAPFAGNLLQKFDLRIVLSVSVLLVAAGLLGCSFWTQIWQFYASGVVIGFGVVSLMFLAIPTLVNRWFAKRTGFFIGLCFAMSGIGGAVWSMVGGILIADFSWRTAYLVFSAAVLVLGLLATLGLVRSYPSEVGLRPYRTEGERESDTQQNGTQQDCSSDEPVAKQWGVSAHVMFRSPVFYLLMVSMGLFNALTVVVNLYASYIYHLGDAGLAGITPESAVLMASSVAAGIMAVAALGKVVLGALCDKSMMAALSMATLCGLASIVLMWVGESQALLIYVGGALGGVLYAAIDGLAPSLTRQVVGPRDYTIIYSRIAMFVNFAGAFAATAFTAVSEISWEAEWMLGIAVVAASFALGAAAVLLARKTLTPTYE